VKRFLILTALAAAFSATIAGSQTTPAAPAAAPTGGIPIPRTAFISDMDAEFRQRDADRNGILTKRELENFQRALFSAVAQNRNQQLFRALDADKNGALTAAEFGKLPMNTPEPNIAPVFAQTDGNRDGQITLVEYRAGKLRNFDNMDTDKDGIVSVAELKAAGLVK
jgi:Ca2+-binding EF-hand superfamily protein